MSEWTEYLKSFTGLVAIVNPIGAIPLYITLTANQTAKERHRTEIFAGMTVALVLTFALMAGETFLRFFGITISSFAVGGGILILLIAISMMHGQLSLAKHTEEEGREAADKSSVAVVPLEFPCWPGLVP